MKAGARFVSALLMVVAVLSFFSCDRLTGNHGEFWFEYNELTQDDFVGTWVSYEEGQPYKKVIWFTKTFDNEYQYLIKDYNIDAKAYTQILSSGTFELEHGEEDENLWQCWLVTLDRTGYASNELYSFSEGDNFTLYSMTADDGVRLFERIADEGLPDSP